MLPRRSFRLPVLAAAGLALGCSSPTSSAAIVSYRALRAALYHLKEAREEVHDQRLGRQHQDKIERDVKTAIREIEKALEVPGKP